MIVREATQADVLEVVQRMRASDAREQFASRFEEDCEDARLRLAYELLEARSVAIKHYCLAQPLPQTPSPQGGGVPVALVGAFLQAPGVAAVHQVATEAWPAIARAATRFYRRRFIPFVLAPNVRLAECHVAADDATTLRWFGLLGFTPVSRPLPYGKNGELFVQLAWINPASP